MFNSVVDLRAFGVYVFALLFWLFMFDLDLVFVVWLFGRCFCLCGVEVCFGVWVVFALVGFACGWICLWCL